MQTDATNIYVPYSSEDEGWGLYLLDVGKVVAPPHSEYPLGPHPPDYIFNFEKGRVLHEYQVIYISEGAGVFYSRTSGRIPVATGSVIIIFPGEWHRYRPLNETGWKESWIGFNGTLADQILNSSFFSKEEPVIKIGIHSRVNLVYDRIIAECKQENPGYQQVAAGMIVELLGLIQMFKRASSLNNRYIQSKIYQSRRMIEETYREDIDPAEIAENVGMGYSNFRKHFRLMTGFSPRQFVIHLRLRESKELLCNTSLTVKEIAARVGFNSSFYFIRIFKEKVGSTPRTYRMKTRGLA